jgi:prolyl-tRNA synthetase
MELMGLPHRIVISDRGLEAGNVEYKARRHGEAQDIPLADILDFLKQQIG